MSDPFILLWLEAPLQSWGFDSKFGRRDSLAFPTRSGIMGLLCCALGAGGEQRELLAELAPMTLQVISYSRAVTYPNQTGEKQRAEPMLCDFHMVGSGYDDSNPWENLLIPKKSDGSKPNGSGTKMTYRYYLQDAAFAAVFQVPSRLVDLITEKLQNPVWDIYLGRKSCAPTEFVFQGFFDSSEIAVQKATEIAQAKGRVEDFHVCEGLHAGEHLTLNDLPIVFGERKEYRDRQVTIMRR